MVATEKYSRYRWKEGRERDLFSFVDGKVRDGSSVTAALKEYGKKHEMSWLTARWKYYQVRKRALAVAQKRSDAGVASHGGPADRPFTPDEEDFLGYLAEFVTSSRDSGGDIVPFIKGLSRMAAMSRESARLKEERDSYRAATREDAEALEGVCCFLEDWLSLSQVDRVGSLKEFSDQLTGELARLAKVRNRLADS